MIDIEMIFDLGTHLGIVSAIEAYQHVLKNMGQEEANKFLEFSAQQSNEVLAKGREELAEYHQRVYGEDIRDE